MCLEWLALSLDYYCQLPGQTLHHLERKTLILCFTISDRRVFLPQGVCESSDIWPRQRERPRLVHGQPRTDQMHLVDGR